MRTIPDWLSLQTWVLLVVLAIIVFYRMLTGGINTSGLLHVKGGRSGFSPARLQLLVSTIAFSCYYVAQVVNNTEGNFPPVPQEMLLLLGGSHMFYLGAKSLGSR